MNRTEGIDKYNTRRNPGPCKNIPHASENGESSAMANLTTSNTILRTDSHSPDSSSRNIYRISEARSRADPFTFTHVSTMSGSDRSTVRKKPSSNSTSASAYTTAATNADEIAVDLDHRLSVSPIAPVTQAPKSRLASIVANNNTGTSATLPYRRRIGKEKSDKGKQRSKSRDLHPQSFRRMTPIDPAKGDAKEFGGGTEIQSHAHGYSGPLAAAEFERMKKEVETLKKVVHNNKKDIRGQAKLIDELRGELSAETTARKEHEARLQELKTRSKTNEEFMTAIETSIQCQICMEILAKPFALAPCGHILCLPCLQEWFRKAPSSTDDMDDMDIDSENDPEYILNRPKSCPCCRAIVVRRPVPVFVVKAVAAALRKAKGVSENGGGSPVSSGTTSLNGEEDPWKGLFPSVDDEDSEGYDDDDDEDDDDDDDEVTEEELEAWGIAELGSFDYHPEHSSTSGSEEDSEGEGSEDDGPLYTLPRWEPPLVDSNQLHSDFSDLDLEEISMLRRGCTVGMIKLFGMRYTHREGLIAHLRSFHHYPYENGEGYERKNRIFLGWNVTLENRDFDGVQFMALILTDMENRPERWEIEERLGLSGALDATRLVKVDDVDEYTTTDTEAWLEAGDVD